MKQKILRGGYVVNGKGLRRADVLIEGEKIIKVGHVLQDAAWDAEYVDVKGQYIFPGFIDAHTHFDLDVRNTTTADDFASGSLAALHGGTTTVIDFACPNKGETLTHGLSLWRKKAEGRCFCDYGFHMTLDDWNETIEGELDDMFAAGISSFKMYTTYPAMQLDDASIYRALKKVKEKGGICAFHCENSGIIDGRIAELKALGRAAEVSSHSLSRPDYAEAEAVSRILRIAQAADVPVIIVHLTNEEALHEVERARRRGQTVYVETCPQYLFLDDGVYFSSDFDEAASFVCAPPLRTTRDQEALLRGMRRGQIQIVSTDHCSFTIEQKRVGKEDFTKIPGGVPGVETRGMLLYTETAHDRLSLGAFCRLLSENPAKLYGLFPRKGAILPGSDADIVVYDPRGEYVLRAEDLLSKAGYTPYEGFTVSGRITRVFLRGQLMVRDGKVVAETAKGRYLQRSVCCL